MFMRATDATDASPTRHERHMATLAELTEIGMDLARELRREVMEAGAEPPADVALRFARIAKAVRQCVALEARLAADADLSTRRAVIDEARLKAERKKAGFEKKAKVAYMFDHMASEAAEEFGDEADIEDLDHDLAEWLFDDRDDEAFANKSVGEIMLDICRTLGLEPDPEEWSEEAWEAAVRETYAPYDRADGDPVPPAPPH